MRTIKFRLRDRDNTIVGYEKWYEGSWNNDEERYVADPKWLYSKDGEHWNPTYIWHRYKDQTTNLLDKNGKEIFEGDILEFEEEDHGFMSESKKVRREVKWQMNYGAGWNFGSHWKDGEKRWSYDLPYGAEIIGNIYENPELIK